MAYADLIDDEGIVSEYLAILKPARTLTGFALFSGSVYSLSFDYGEVVEVTQNGVALTAALSTSLSAGQFYYDVEAEVLYVRMTDSSNPSTKFVVGTYEIYAGTLDAHFNRVPTDNTTREVYFDPVIAKAPEVKNSQADGIFGLVPVQRTAIELINAEHFLEKHIYDSSFLRREIRVYHWLESLETDNVKEVLRGFMGDISYSESKVRIDVTDRVDKFVTQFRNPGTSFWATSDFPTIDPKAVGKPIPYIYGRVRGVFAVNLDYNASAPTTSNNRVWGVRADKTKLNNVTRTIAAGSTTTVINLTSTQGLFVGDAIRIVTGTESTFITVVGPTSVTVSPAVTAPGAGDTVTRLTIARISLIQQSVRYDLLPTRDYTQTTSLAADVLGFTLTSSAESNVGAQTFDPNSDTLHVAVYGKQNDVTLGGPSFGSNSTTTSNLTAPAPILVDLLKSRLGLPESELAAAAFTALNSATTEDLSFAIPSESSQVFPTFKAILEDIIKTVLLRVFVDDNGDVSVKRLAPLGTAEFTTDIEEILKNSFSYSFSYQDILSDAFVQYSKRERSDIVSVSGPEYDQVTAMSNTAKYLHGVSKQKTFQSIHLLSTHAQDLADKFSFIFGDRQGTASIRVKNKFFGTELSDVIQVDREKLPGFAFEEGTAQSRKFAALETSKDLRSISIRLDDQKGIEDNSGSW